jgi:hypothetical protein
MKSLYRWRTDIRRQRLTGGARVGHPRGGASRPCPMVGGPPSGGYLLVSYRVFLELESIYNSIFFLTSFISFPIFLITPYRNTDSPKLWNSVSINPNPMLEIDMCPFSMFGWRFKMIVNYCQQDSPSLTFASPLAKPNLVISLGVFRIFKIL